MRCAKCGTESKAAKKFCAECGSPLSNRCSKCGSDNAFGAKFCSDCGTSLSASAPFPIPVESAAPSVRITAPAEASPLDGERKTVTALFADIKASTELEQDLDPEEARAIVDPALKLMIDAVQRYDGYVVQSTGDGIFALFGAPVAHEDHPQRALYAALRMQEEIRRYADRLRADGRAPIQIRVGVNTGEVVVRTIATGEGHLEYTPIGHTTNLASRMQTLADPGATAISESTRRLVEGYFTLKPLGPARIKGVTDPVNLYEVTGLGPLRTRLQRSAGRGFTKFVGREREMDAMRHAAERAKSAHGQIVAEMAEAGVGKSRLLFEFKATTAADWMVLEAFSVSHGKASSYLPVIDLLHSYFKIASQDDQRTRREKIAGRIAILDRTLEDTTPYLCGLLGIAEDPDPLAQMDPHIRKRGTLDAIKRILLRESLNQPLMVIFEDLHWIDDETQALLNILADSIATAKILLLVNYRPEYSHQWGSKTYYTQLRLDPLGHESADKMLQSMLGDSTELGPLKRLIIEKTEGNPFFMEETVEVLLDDGALVRDGAAVSLTKPLADLKIPPTVRAILAARIDRLSPADKDLLQTLAVIGKEFPLSLVRAVVAASADDLAPMLDDLQLSEFIYEQPAFGDIEYTFKHALTQEVAYNSILIERRKTLHERIGAAVGELFKDSIDDHLSELADHYARSSNLEKAVECQALAAKRELSQSGYQGALRRLENAIELFAKLPDSRERAELELDLQIDYGAALLVTKGWWVPEAGKAFSRARELCQQKEEDPRLYRVLSGLHSFHLVRGEHPTALAYTDELIALADRFRNGAMQADAHLLSGFSKFFMGEFADAHSSLELCIGYHARQRHLNIGLGAADQDPLMSALCYDAMTLWFLGHPDQAAKRAGESLERARELGSPFTLTWCLSQLGMYYTIRRDFDAAEKTTTEGLSLARKHGLAFLEAQILAYRLIGSAAQGKFGQTADRASTESGYAEVGYELAHTWARSILAQGFASVGQIDTALALIAQSAALVERNQERYVESEVDRIKGELTLLQAKDLSNMSDEVRTAASAAEQSFMKAIEVARRQRAKSLELRATVSLARLLRDTDRRNQGRATLAEIYNQFTEGLNTPDLKDAKSLRAELGG
jgi:class 3 adenylate cyclase/tetratricopeptide (TPR) repeat protein